MSEQDDKRIVSVSELTVVLVFSVTFLLAYRNTRRQGAVPPGPHLWPVIGNLLSLAHDPVGSMKKLRSKYGDVVGLYIGSQLTIFVNGYDAVHEVLVRRGTLFSWRPETAHTKQIIIHKSIVFENGQQWKENRQFTQNVFQKLCFSKGSMSIEDKINEELSFFVDKLKILTKPTDIANALQFSLANVIFSILHGRRTCYTDKNMQWYLNTLDREFKVFRRNQLVTDCFPFLCKIPFDPLGIYKRSGKMDKLLAKHFENMCLENVDTYVEGAETCFVHHLMTEYRANNTQEWNDTLLNRQLWTMLHDLTAAGSETSATTLRWILLYLAREPDIQKKAQIEVDSVIGKDETPSLSHRKQLPYLEAIALEGLRIGHIVPFGIPHAATHDVNFKGYHIPKNTPILLNLASVLKDPIIFPDPDSFRPDRFLSSDGQSVIIPDEFIPFSKGPRSCLGESIARIELFLYMATLVQKFEFRATEGEVLPDCEGVIGITHYPKPYKLTIVSR